MINSFTSRTCIVLSLCLLVSSIYAQVGVNLEDQVYAGPIRGATGIVFDKNGNLYTHDIYGAVYQVKRGESKPTLWLDIREEVGNYGDHGLLGMALDRDFLENGRFYLYYNVDMYWYKNVGKPGYDKNRSLENYPSFGRLTRYTANVKGDFSVDVNSRKVLIGETHDTGVPVLTLSHLGGGLAIGTDGTILIGTGDGSSFEQVDTGCNSTTWVDLAIQEEIIKYISNSGTTIPEPCSNSGYYDKNRVTENIGAYRAQALFSLSGKILRINPETGDGLPSNPFYDASLGPRAAQNRVYALGLRQAFRISVRPSSGSTNPQDGKPGVVYVGDVGFSNWEELNVVTQPGQNFGWPYYEGILKGREGYWKSKAFEPMNPVKPRVQWRDNKYTEIVQGETVTNLNKTVLEGGCVIGGAWHEGGGNYPIELQNTYYFADYNAGWIAGIRLGHDNEPEINSLFKVTKKIVTDAGGQRLTHVAFNPYDRNMYYITFGEAGVIRRLVVSNDQPPVAVITQDKAFGSSPLAVNFSAKESYDPEGKPLKYEWNVSDGAKSTAMNYLKTFTSTTPKSYTITLKVTDDQNKTNSTQTVISVNNTPPIIQYTSVDNLGQIRLSSPYTINLNATATDSESPGQLSYRWTVYLYHNDHRHTVSTVPNQTGSITVSEGSCDGTASYWYGVVLDVTDANGLNTTYTKFLYLDCPGTSQTINFASISNRGPTAPPFNPQVIATSGLPISLFAVDGPAVIENGQIKLSGGIGLVTVRATQHGNGQYRYAQPVERSFMVTNNVPSTPDTQAPSAPSGLAASNITTTSLQLNWNAASDNVAVTGYDIYQGGNKINSNIVNATTFAVSGLTPNTNYAFVVVARDAALNTSGNSNTANAKTLEAAGNQPPLAPSGLSLNAATINVSYTSNALTAFSDPEGDALTYTLTGLPANLTFNAANRTITGTAASTGTFSLTYAASDNQHPAVTTTLTLTVNGTTTIPSANLDGYLTQEVNCSTLSGWAWDRTNPNAAVTIEFFDGASVAAGTPLGSIVANIFQQHLKDAGKGNGEHWYNFPIPESVKTSTNHTIWARVVGSEFILKWAPKTINCAGTGIPPANQPPVPPALSSLSALVNTSFSSAALATFTDPENTPLTYTLTGLPNNLTFNPTTRVVSGMPLTTGTFSLTYSATDQPGAKTNVVFSLVVNETNNPPANVPPAAPVVSPLSATVNVAFATTLPAFTDTDPLSYTLTGLPSGLSFNAANRGITGTPTQQGTFTLTYLANDGKVTEEVTLTLTVNPGSGTPPPVTGSFDGYLDVVNCSTLSGWIWDRDKPNTPITVEFLDGANLQTATAIGTTLADIFRQDLKNAGKGNGSHGYSFVVPEILKDNQTHTIWARVPGSTYTLKWAPKTITCVGTGTPPANAAPVAPAVSPLSATINVGFTASALAVFTDAENDPLTYTLTGLPANLTFNASTRVISGTPTVSGTFTLTYAATDNKHSPVSTTFVLTVNAGETEPPANVPPAPPVVSPLSATVNVAFATTLPAFTDTDPLSYTLTGLPSGLSFNAGNRGITGTPTQQGTFTLTYLANDGKVTEDVTITLTVAVGGTTPPPAPAGNFDGYLIKDVSCNTFSGWAWERAKGNAVVTIEFFEGTSIVAGRLIGTIAADVFKQHLLDAGKGNGAHWFDFSIPEDLKDGENHTIWARVQNSEFVLKDAPKTINCAGTGTPPANAAPVAPAVSPLSATINVGFTASALTVFTDAENDPLTYTLTGLPANLTFNASTRVISGTPTVSGTFTLTYAATDNKHSPVSTTFVLTVNTSGGTTNPPTSGGSGPGNYEGYLDVVSCSSIQGWLWDRDRPNTPITVEFLDGNTVIGAIDANIFRQDLKTAGKGNGIHGYSFEVPAALKNGQNHSISGRVPGGNFTLKWSPKTLNCPVGSRQGVSADKEVELSMELTVSPNPSRGRVEISYRVEADRWADLQVVDMMGRPLWQKPLIGTGQVERETVELSLGGANVYLIQLQTAKQIVTRRLLIHR